MNPQEVLLDDIEKKRTEFKNENYPMSIGELSNLYKSGELVINPDFQRFFRWTELQKTRLIESIMLRIPLPSIFVFQRDDGIWELVDGLQRVSTILQFMGDLKEKTPLILHATKYLPSIEGFQWDNPKNLDYEIPESMKLHFKRSKLNISIIIGDTGTNAKFEVFQRLNTGGSYASDQEVRNSMMIMINKPVYEWLTGIASNENFINTLSISDRLYDEQYNVELALRFVALLKYTYNPKNDVKDYLDDVTEQILLDKTFNFQDEEELFKKIFLILNNILNENSFKRFDGSNFKGKFLESAFEAISIGLASNLNDYVFPNDNELLKEKIEKMHLDPHFRRYTGSGSNAKTRIPNLTNYAKKHFKK